MSTRVRVFIHDDDIISQYCRNDYIERQNDYIKYSPCRFSRYNISSAKIKSLKSKINASANPVIARVSGLELVLMCDTNYDIIWGKYSEESEVIA